MKKIVLIFNLILPLVCLFFFSLTSPVPILVWACIGLLCLPAAVVLAGRQEWLKAAYVCAIIALCLVVLISSYDLWSNLLASRSPALANHLLVLLFALLLVANLQMHAIVFQPAFSDLSCDQKVAHSLRGPNLSLAFIAATVITNLSLVLLYTSEVAQLQPFAEKFLTRGIIPPITLLLFFWGLILLAAKSTKVVMEKSPNRDSGLNQAFRENQSPQNFFDSVWQHFESFYVLPRYINWAIPILGFIGTVLGISLATESLASLLDTTEADFSELLSSALSPLGIAFDTTLIALSLSIILTLIQTLVYRWEEKILIRFEQQTNYS